MIDSSMILKATFEKIIESINIGIFDLLHTGVALFCDKGFFIYCNKSFLKMYNLPESVIGKHITDYFLTGERGVMSSIRTRKMVICSSQTKNNVWGVSFRYPIQDEQGQLRGVVVESIPSNLDKDKLLALLDTVRNLEMKSYSFSEQKEAHKNSGLYTFEAIVGEAPCIENMRCLGRRFAFSQEPILVCGESGTGKELVAQALHMASQRSDRPFVTVNCAALPPELMETYEKRKNNYNQTASKAEQIALTQFIRDGHLASQVRKSRKIHLAKAEKLAESIHKVFGDTVNVKIGEAGFMVQIIFSNGTDVKKVAKAARKEGLTFREAEGHTLLLTCAGVESDKYEEAMQILAKCVIIDNMK